MPANQRFLRPLRLGDVRRHPSRKMYDSRKFVVFTAFSCDFSLLARVNVYRPCVTPKLHLIISVHLSRSPPLRRRHLSYDDCLEDKRENYHKSSVLCCVQQL